MDTRSMASITRQAPNMTSDELDWRQKSFCKDWDFKKKGDPWHPASESEIAARPGKNLCWSCPAREACLADALAHNEKHGIRGGFTATERSRYRK